MEECNRVRLPSGADIKQFGEFDNGDVVRVIVDGVTITALAIKLRSTYLLALSGNEAGFILSGPIKNFHAGINFGSSYRFEPNLNSMVSEYDGNLPALYLSTDAGSRCGIRLRNSLSRKSYFDLRLLCFDEEPSGEILFFPSWKLFNKEQKLIFEL